MVIRWNAVRSFGEVGAQCFVVIAVPVILLHTAQWDLGFTLAFIAAAGIWLQKHGRKEAEKVAAAKKAKEKDEQAIRLLGAPVADLRLMFGMSDELIDRLLSDPKARAIAAAALTPKATAAPTPKVDFIQRNPVPDSVMLGQLIQKPDRAG